MDPVVGPCPEAAVLRGFGPQCHHVGHRGPQRTNFTATGTPVSPPGLRVWVSAEGVVWLKGPVERA